MRSRRDGPGVTRVPGSGVVVFETPARQLVSSTVPVSPTPTVCSALVPKNQYEDRIAVGVRPDAPAKVRESLAANVDRLDAPVDRFEAPTDRTR